MKCPICGAEISEGSSFCTACGAAINQSGYQQPYGQPQQTFGQSQQPYNQSGYGQPYSQPAFGQPGQYRSPSRYKKRYNIGNILLYPALVIVSISVFLPYMSISEYWYSESINLFGSKGDLRDGVFFLGLAVVAFIFNLCKLNTGNIIISLLLNAMLIVEISNGNEVREGMERLIHYGAGYYLLIVGCILALIASILGLALHISAKKKFVS